MSTTHGLGSGSRLLPRDPVLEFACIVPYQQWFLPPEESCRVLLRKVRVPRRSGAAYVCTCDQSGNMHALAGWSSVRCSVAEYSGTFWIAGSVHRLQSIAWYYLLFRGWRDQINHQMERQVHQDVCLCDPAKDQRSLTCTSLLGVACNCSCAVGRFGSHKDMDSPQRSA